MDLYRHVRDPGPCTIGTKPDGTEAKFTLFDLIEWLVRFEDRFTKTGDGGRAAARLREIFKSKPKTAELHPDDWKILYAAAEKPSCGYPMFGVPGSVPYSILSYIIPLLDALSEERTREEARPILSKNQQKAERKKHRG